MPVVWARPPDDAIFDIRRQIGRQAKRQSRPDAVQECAGLKCAKAGCAAWRIEPSFG